MIKIALVDDHQIVLEGLRFLFSSVENVEVVGLISDSRDVITYLNNHHVDILVTDLQMPHCSGIDLILQTKVNFPSLKILLLTMSEDINDIRNALKAGVHGYLLKKTDKKEIEKAITSIIHGKRYFSQEVIDELAHVQSDDFNDNRVETIQILTRREIEILQLISSELSTLEIADKLFISIPTVETHRRNLMSKLQVKNLAGLVKYAIKHGLA